MQDLQEAIHEAEQGVDMKPKGHLNLPTWLNNLSNLLGYRFERTGSIDDLEKAISIALSRDQPASSRDWRRKPSRSIGQD